MYALDASVHHSPHVAPLHHQHHAHHAHHPHYPHHDTHGLNEQQLLQERQTASRISDESLLDEVSC